MAWDDSKVANDDFLSSDWNAMVTYLKLAGIPNTENKLGSDCTGSDGATGRVLTLANTSTMKTAGFMVFRNGALIVPGDITVTATGSADTVTFDNTNIFDLDVLTVIYST